MSTCVLPTVHAPVAISKGMWAQTTDWIGTARQVIIYAYTREHLPS